MSTGDDLDRALKDWADHRVAPAPSPSDVDQLMRRAAGRRWLWWLWVPATFGAAFMVLLAVGVAVLAWPEPDRVVVSPLPPPVVPEAVAMWTGHVEEDGDVFDIEGTLTPQGTDAARVLTLEGVVRVEAVSRSADQALVIGARDWRVRVVGTRFTVVSEPFSVAVEEGKVAVTDLAGQGPWVLEAGDRFENGVVVREPAPAVPVPAPRALPTLAALRAHVVAGRLDEARGGLNARLAEDPSELEAWSLLARLEARAGQRAAAADAWEQLVQRGDGATAQRARYEAAVLREEAGTPRRAIPLLRAFLEHADPLAPEARLRLGRALLAVGDASGRTELERVVRDHPGTAAAQAAEARLEER